MAVLCSCGGKWTVLRINDAVNKSCLAMHVNMVTYVYM